MNEKEEKRITLEIRGIGHVPSFKNNKSIFRNRSTGKPFVATQPRKKLWMEQAIQLIESQLLSEFRTTSQGTMTGASLRSWIASSLPLDDSRQWVVEIHVKSFVVEKGNEGAHIVIQKIWTKKNLS